MKIIRNLLVYTPLLLVFSCGGPELPQLVSIEYAELPKHVDFNIHVKPILSDKCYLCHGPDEAKIEGGLQLHTQELAFSELKESPGKFAIVPGNLKRSEMFHRIVSEDPNYVMPEPGSHLTLTDREKAILIKWIEQGAGYEDHWAFIKPKEYDIPKVKNKEVVVNPIDNFILSRLEQEDLSPAPLADREILLRRLYLDLTGLPPTLADIESFLADDAPDAYERQVDKLLATPQYGEQMALDWMDLSRFADTHGYSVDRYRDMSPWRDWVIGAFNKNMPYDQFVTWQLAGDLMENPSREMILATAFNRIHPQNMEGGIVNEEFLVEYAVDRASTVGQAFLGLTVACARCHDHKYDPISHKNFYQMTDFFNNVNESGQIAYNDAMPVPTLRLTTEEEDKVLAYMDNLIAGTEKEIELVERTEVASDFATWLSEGGHRAISSKEPSRGLTAAFDLNDPSLKNALGNSGNGTMKREGREGQQVHLVEGKEGKGVLLDGDTWLDLRKAGVFGRNDAFSISLWANIPADIESGNIFHKGDGAILYNWRGYHLRIVENRLELMLAHTAPNNAITEITKTGFPRDEWVHLTMTYDGSSKAEGLRIYVNGKEQETEVIIDNLYKDILFRNRSEPGLQLGARYRGKGIKGAVVDQIKVFERDLSVLEILQLAKDDGLGIVFKKGVSELTSVEKSLLQEYYTKAVSLKTKEQLGKLAELRKDYVDSMEKVKEVMVMEETPVPVPSYILDRGVYDARGEEVFPNTPEAILPMPEDYPKNRLGFSKWLFHEDHPLTARVAVNRFWQHYFGFGLVKTSEDFGNQGEMPSHPRLLDWLSINFMESGWDVKALQKMIVMSHTYRQSSLVDGELSELDKDNRLLARGPSKRLTAEMLRDNALAGSGLLNKTIGGESVYPYQPEGLWRVNGATYHEDTGDKLYRRSMYTIWKRSVPHPTLATFDAPARDYCTTQRQETNTPLQALVLLNDPTYIEAARVLGKQMGEEGDLRSAISNVFKKLTGRSIMESELQLLVELREIEYKKFSANLDKAKGWLNTGEFKLEGPEDKAMVAANSVIANTIMNSDACVVKR